MIKAPNRGISVIVPYKNQAALTLICVESFVWNISDGSDYEIVLVNNNSEKDQADLVRDRSKNLFKDREHGKVKNLDYPHQFNFQKINNWAAKHTRYDTLLFLNNDAEITKHSGALIDRMYDKAQQGQVGAVGCLLMYEDGIHIQHAGVYLQNGGMAAHIGARERLSNYVKSDRIFRSRALTAVTAACLMIQKNKFDSVGGFNERFTIGGGDVDLCIRLNQAGYQTWYVAPMNSEEYILHKESISRVGMKLPFNDYVYSYYSYIKGLDDDMSDPYVKNYKS